MEHTRSKTEEDKYMIISEVFNKDKTILSFYKKWAFKSQMPAACYHP